MRTVAIVGTTIGLVVAACGGSNGSDVFGGGDDGGAGGGDAALAVDGSGGGGGKDGGGNADGGGNGDAGRDGSVAPLPDGGVNGVPGVVLWLDAAKGITPDMNVATKVTGWADQSGNGNNANQKNANQMPSIVAAGINGHPTVHFTSTVAGLSNGTMMLVADSATLQWGTGDYLIEVVTRYDNTPSAVAATQAATGVGTFFSKETFNVSPVGVSFVGNTPNKLGAGTTAFATFVDPADGVVSAATGYNNGKPHLLTAQRTGTTILSLRADGVLSAMAAVPSTNVDTVTTIARIGANGDANLARLNGDISEIIAVKGSISAADQAGIEDYLKNKYGL